MSADFTPTKGPSSSARAADADLETGFQVRELNLPMSDFAGLTFPAYRTRLLEPDAHTTAIGATLNGRAAGLALWRTKASVSRLLSVFVRPELRRGGIGRALLNASGDALPKATERVTYWSSALSGAPAFELLLTTAGWSEKRLDTYRCILTPAKVESWAENRTLGRVKERLGPFSWRVWAELSSVDLAEIQRLETTPDVPDGFGPSRFVETSEIWAEHASVLFRHDAPIGWILTRRAASDVWYENFWTMPRFRRGGPQIAMLLSMIRRQGELIGPRSIGRFVTSEQHPEMLAIVRGPFQGCFTFRDEFWTARAPRPA